MPISEKAVKTANKTMAWVAKKDLTLRDEHSDYFRQDENFDGDLDFRKSASAQPYTEEMKTYIEGFECIDPQNKHPELRAWYRASSQFAADIMKVSVSLKNLTYLVSLVD